MVCKSCRCTLKTWNPKEKSKLFLCWAPVQIQMRDVRPLKARLLEKGLHQACAKLLLDFPHLPLLLSESSSLTIMFLWKNFNYIKMPIASWKPCQQLYSFYFFIWEFQACTQCTLTIQPHSVLPAPLGLPRPPPTFMSSFLFISFLSDYDLPSPVGAAYVSMDVEPCTGARATYKRPHHARKMTLPLLAATNCQ